MARKDRKDEERDQGGARPADDGWGTYVHGTRPIAGEQPPGTASPFVPGQPAAAQPGRGRTWLILLSSFLVQLVVVLAAGNTTVVEKADKFSRDNDNVLGAFGLTPGVYSWRLTAQARDLSNAYPAMLFGLLAFFVVAALLTTALIRGPITFWRAFVAVWLSVLAATLANGMVRRGVADLGGDKAIAVLFRGTGVEVMAGVVTGLLAGLVAAIVAVKSRRPAEAIVPLVAPEQAPYVEPTPPPPWHGDDVRSPALVPAVPAAPPPSFRKPQSDDTQATTQFAASPSPAPAAEESAGATTRLRREDAGQYGPPTVVGRGKAAGDETPPDRPVEDKPADDKPAESAPESQQTAALPVPPRPQPGAAAGAEQSTQALPARSAPENQSTQAFPRPPDDEDLGHQPDDD